MSIELADDHEIIDRGVPTSDESVGKDKPYQFLKVNACEISLDFEQKIVPIYDSGLEAKHKLQMKDFPKSQENLMPFSHLSKGVSLPDLFFKTVPETKREDCTGVPQGITPSTNPGSCRNQGGEAACIEQTRAESHSGFEQLAQRRAAVYVMEELECSDDSSESYDDATESTT